MSEALYRKYRPQTFEDVVGQTHIERTLKNAIESDKVSHAYLFCGPRGTGKTTTARLLAKALLCEGGPTPSPDGTCEQCRAIADGTHPDVNEMDAASRTGVENVREEIIGRVQYAPIRGRYKIYIIDEVHMLSTAAFNALLKTLEEPPDHVVFILCTTDPQKVPETIHSRCQRFDFHRLSNEEIVSRLGAVCMSEGVQFEGDALDLIAHRAQGGMRDALTTLEQLIAFGNGSVTTEVACNVLGSLDVDDIGTIVDAIATRDAAACFTWLSEYIETGADLAQFTRDLAAYVRDLYVLELTDGALSVDAPASLQNAMTHEAKKFGPDRLAYILRVLGDLSTELRSSTNARLSFEIALTRMVRPESDLTLESLAARIEALEAVVTAPASGRARVTQENATQASASSASANKSVDFASGVAEAKEVLPATMPKEKKPQETRSWPTPSASVPRASSGYKPVTQQEASSSAIGATTAAMNKAASLRAQMEQRQAVAPSSAVEQRHNASNPAVGSSVQRAATPSQATAATPFENSMSPSPPISNQDVPASANTSNTASDSMRVKLMNPAALQRGWKAALSELKRQRAVYAALMQSARIVAEPDGSGIVIEFSKENNFAFSAAQKPDVVAALSAALKGAFGGTVPLRFAQGDGIVAGIHAAAPSTPSPASVEYEQASSHTAELKAATGMEVRQEQGSKRTEHDQAHPYATPADTAVSPASKNEPAPKASLNQEFDLNVTGPAPVDPYPMGKKLGFDSMVASARQSGATVPAKGWPGISSEKKSDGAANEHPETSQQPVEVPIGLEGSIDSAASAPVPTDKRDFAAPVAPKSSRGLARSTNVSDSGNPASSNSSVRSEGVTTVNLERVDVPDVSSTRPETSPGDSMEIADIFSTFGVSMEDVQEED